MSTRSKQTPEDSQQRIRELLVHNILEITFVKKDRTKRTGRMTLNLDLIPVEKRPKGTGREPKSGYLFVYDFTRMGWRTIRPAHVTSYRVLEPTPNPSLKGREF